MLGSWVQCAKEFGGILSMKLTPSRTGPDEPPASPTATTRNLLPFAWLFLLAIVITAALLVLRPAPALDIPVPADLPNFDPQLRAYLQEKIAAARQNPRAFQRQAELGL